jgi:hypothetical protein
VTLGPAFSWRRAVLAASAAIFALPAVGAAQAVSFAGGRVSVGGEAALTIGPRDRWFFNYTDYQYSALRLARFDLSGAWRPAKQVELVADVRTENFDSPHMLAVYLRVRPWASKTFDLQAGRIPPAFGAFTRRNYASDTPLIGYPLAYQYLTSLRPDALPATSGDLLRMRGRGWLSNFPIGVLTPAAGMPLVNAFRWDTGVQARVGSRPIEVLAAVTTGTLSSPRLRDDNGGKQISGRVVSRPTVGLVLGVSAARGPYLSDDVLEIARATTPGQRTGHQTVWGADAEYSRGYWLVRAEGVWSAWGLPALPDPGLGTTLHSSGLMIEGRYKIRPGLYVAARGDHLDFSELRGVAWDAPVWRVESGAGVSLRRNLLFKAVYQYSRRVDTQAKLHAFAGQLVAWF